MHHHRDEAGGDDGALADIEQRQRAAGADRRRLVAPAADVVAARLVLLVAEILDRLVVQQAVDRLGVGLGVGVVHAAHELDAPLRQRDREHDVAGDDGQRSPPRSASRRGSTGCRRPATISSRVGRMLKVVKRIRNSMPCVPRSMTRLSPPVWRSRWKRSESAWRWPNTSRARLRIARCDTGAKTASRISPKRLRQHARHAVGHDQRDRHGDGLRRCRRPARRPPACRGSARRR